MPTEFIKSIHLQKGNEFLKELAIELGDKSDLKKAGRILRAVLHTLRNHLPIEASFHLLSQLPLPIKAVYVDGWSPNKQMKSTRKKKDFIEEMMREDWSALRNDFLEFDDGVRATKAVFRVLKSHISEGEFKDMEATLPKEIKELLKDTLSYKKLTLKLHPVL